MRSSCQSAALGVGQKASGGAVIDVSGVDIPGGALQVGLRRGLSIPSLPVIKQRALGCTHSAGEQGPATRAGLRMSDVCVCPLCVCVSVCVGGRAGGVVKGCVLGLSNPRTQCDRLCLIS